MKQQQQQQQQQQRQQQQQQQQQYRCKEARERAHLRPGDKEEWNAERQRVSRFDKSCRWPDVAPCGTERNEKCAEVAAHMPHKRRSIPSVTFAARVHTHGQRESAPHQTTTRQNGTFTSAATRAPPAEYPRWQQWSRQSVPVATKAAHVVRVSGNARADARCPPGSRRNCAKQQGHRATHLRLQLHAHPCRLSFKQLIQILRHPQLCATHGGRGAARTRYQCPFWCPVIQVRSSAPATNCGRVGKNY